MPSFKALQNTDVEKLQSQSALRKRFLLWLIACMLESSSSRKFSFKNILNLIKGRNVLNDVWSITTCIQVCSITVQWRSCALVLQSLSASTTLVPWHQGNMVWIRESAADSTQRPSTAASHALIHPRILGVQTTSFTLLFKNHWFLCGVITLPL